MVYVALLRGINVGGKNKVDMKILKTTFKNAGMEQVSTYINSGNIVFIDKVRQKNEIVSILEAAILKDFNLEIRVVVLNFNEYKYICQAVPEAWQNNKETRSDVMFLWEEIDDPSIMEQLVIHPEIDIVKYIKGAVLWSADFKQISKSGKMKLAGSKLYKQMTIRNVNTTRKIFEIMNSLK